MTTPAHFLNVGDQHSDDEHLFNLIAQDIERQGFSIRPTALPERISSPLYLRQQELSSSQYADAGIGRNEGYLTNAFVRTDEICWIGRESDAERLWLRWTSGLQQFLNRKLYLGLFSFESHFAHYSPGDYYKRHVDAFHGDSNRVLSVVVYLTPNWHHSDGGELVLYMDDKDKRGIKVLPLFGTMVVFLAEEFPHEVLPAKRDRYSIAGWFRVNASINNKIDPPR
jgi:SM-20-related protein